MSRFDLAYLLPMFCCFFEKVNLEAIHEISKQARRMFSTKRFITG
jgi:hypothetical protein